MAEVGRRCRTLLNAPVARVIRKRPRRASLETALSVVFSVACLRGWTLQNAGFGEVVGEVVRRTFCGGLADSGYWGTIGVSRANWHAGLRRIISPQRRV